MAAGALQEESPSISGSKALDAGIVTAAALPQRTTGMEVIAREKYLGRQYTETINEDSKRRDLIP